MKARFILLTAAAIWGSSIPLSLAQSVPPLINYQGRLSNASGAPIAGTVPMHFGLLDGDTSGATLLWGETQEAVAVNEGIYHVLLGSVKPIPGSALAGSTVFLEVRVSGETLKPRQRLTSVAYALAAENSGQAANAQTLNGLYSFDFAPVVHNHDDLYYFKAQVDAIIANLQSQIAALQTQVNTLFTRISGLETRVTANETDILSLDSRVTATEAALADHETRISELENKLELIYFKVNVAPEDSTWKVTLVKPGVYVSALTYPGVTATRINDQINVEVAANNSNPASLTLTLQSASSSTLPRLWLVLHSINPNARLSTKPDVKNGETAKFSEGEPIFVFGPLAPGQSTSLTLDFTRSDQTQGYTFTFDVLEIETRLVYSSYFGDLMVAEVFTAQPDGNNPFQVTNSGLHAIFPAFAPGGERIAYAGLTTNYNIYTVHPDGSHFTQVSDNADSRHPSFSPDGKKLVYDCVGRSPDPSMDICLNDVEGGNETVLVSGLESIASVLPQYAGTGWYLKQVFLPSWSPDGTKIVFMARHPVKNTRWYFILQPMDPVTKTPVGPLVILNRPWDQLYFNDSTHWMNLNSSVNWGPDSRHAVFDGGHYTVALPPGLCFYPNCAGVQSNRRFYADYVGSYIVDFTALAADPQYGETIGPYLGDYATTVINGQIAPPSPDVHYLLGSLSDTGRTITFESYYGGGLQDVVALPLDGSYLPTSTFPEILIGNGDYNLYPSWTPPLLPGFYH